MGVQKKGNFAKFRLRQKYGRDKPGHMSNISNTTLKKNKIDSDNVDKELDRVCTWVNNMLFKDNHKNNVYHAS